ncbi:MAG: response regulator [Kofleriaceae bacterium]
MIDRKLQALVVDDVAVNLKLLATILRGHGFTVERAESAEAARPLLATGKFGLLLLDVMLPGMDGLTFARELRTEPVHADLIIVAVTANAMKSDRDAALGAGCDAFVSKPINTRTLVPLVTSLLARGRTV